MDLNETAGIVINRHTWEISRTYCVKNEFCKYLDKLHNDDNIKCYINAGAGDCYFDKSLLLKYNRDRLYAIDIAYKETVSNDTKILKFNYLEEILSIKYDYAIMMDSLEYMENDVEYLKKLRII